MLSPAKATHRAALAVVVLTFILNLMSRMGETFAVFLLPIEAEFEWNRATLSTVYGERPVAFISNNGCTRWYCHDIHWDDDCDCPSYWMVPR